MPGLTPDSRLQHHRLKLEGLLSNEVEVGKVFTEFVPMVPEKFRRLWSKPWDIETWLEQQESRCQKEFDLPPDNLASNGTGLDPETVHALMMIEPYFIDAHTPDKSSRQPNASEVSGGLCIYTLAIRLACNFVSSDPTPEVVQNLANVMFKMILSFANYLEDHLEYNQPNSTGTFPATDQNDIAAVTMVISPVEIRDLLETGIGMVVSGLVSENPSLLQWSCIATEVQQGKIAFQNACHDSLTRRLVTSRIQLLRSV